MWWWVPPPRPNNDRDRICAESHARIELYPRAAVTISREYTYIVIKLNTEEYRPARVREYRPLESRAKIQDETGRVRWVSASRPPQIRYGDCD